MVLAMKNYFLNLAEATSQWLNALLGGNPNMTVSARAYVNRRRHPLPYMLINRVFLARGSLQGLSGQRHHVCTQSAFRAGCAQGRAGRLAQSRLVVAST